MHCEEKTTSLTNLMYNYKCISITYVLGTSLDGVGCNFEIVSAGILSEIGMNAGKKQLAIIMGSR